jgi:hypothetical protein
MAAMRVLLFLIAASVCLAQPQSAVFSGTNYLSFTPSGGSFTSMADWRVEFRIAGYGIVGQPQGIYGNNDGDGQCVIVTSTLTLRCRTYRGTSSALDVSLTGRPDVRVRFQRFNGPGLLTLEVWNADGSGYSLVSLAYTPETYNGERLNYVGSLWGSGSECDGSIAFFRWYLATLPTGSPAPPDTVSTGASLADLEMNGNTLDTSPNAWTVTQTGGAPSYITTTLYPPVPVLLAQTVRAGQVLTMSAAGSSNLTDDQPLTYSWNCMATASPCDYASKSGSSAQLRTTLGGTYTVRLQVTDSLGQTGLIDVPMGAVAADANSVVVSPSTKVDLMVGPLLRSGASQWTWFDATEKQLGDAIGASISASPGDTPLVGTISLTNGSTAVTGSGTTFQTTFNCNGTDLIMIHYPVAGGGTGRRVQTVMSCSSDTAMVIDRGYDATTGPESGVSYGRTTNAETAQWVNGSNNWNYYDAVAAFYRLYYRTGIESYREHARSLADKWYKWPFDGGRAWINGQGYWQQQPRMMNLMGLMLRAEDGKPEYWPAIVASADAVYVQWNQNWFPSASSKVIGELREQGYASLFQAGIAVMHPDSAARAAALANANAAFSSYWQPAQSANGGWMFPINPALYYSGDGTLPWQGGFTSQFLTMLHRTTGSSDVLAALKLQADFMDDYGIDPLNDGGYYDAFYTRCPAYDKESQGTVTVTNGSTAITGSGTNFLARYGCNGTDRIAVDMSDGTRLAYIVQSCSSNTAMVISPAHSGATESGVRSLKFPLTGPIDGCGVCPWGTCGAYGTDASAKKAARTLLNASHSPFGYLYALGQGAGYLTIGDRIFGQNLGLGGPGNDGVVGNYDDVLTGGSAPGYLATTYLSKEFAFVGGAAAAQPYLAWRLGVPAALESVNVSVAFRLASVPNATQVRVTLTRPNGESVQQTCSSSPCVLNADKRQGKAQMLMEYLSAGSAVLAASELIAMTI